MPKLSILSKRQQAELIAAIEGRGEIPMKFNYLGNGAHRWDAFTSKGEISDLQTNLIKSRISEFISVLDRTKKLNIIDIGCGNGFPALLVMNKLRDADLSFSYIAIDISKEMLKLATKRIESEIKNIKVKTFELDFERGNFSDIVYDLSSKDSINILLFFGNTLGNQLDMQRVLANFLESMSSRDVLIIGNGLTNISRVSKILSSYRIKEVEDAVYYIATQLGIKESDTDFEVSWNAELSQVEMSMILKRDKDIHIGSERILLQKGEKILLCRSKKFTSWTFTKLFSDIGFRTVLLASNQENSYILSMVQPLRHSQ